MASTETGELYSQEQYDKMTEQERTDLNVVRLTPEEQDFLLDMEHEDRKEYLQRTKKPRKVRGQWHDPRYTKVTPTIRQSRAKNKAERRRKKQGRTN